MPFFEEIIHLDPSEAVVANYRAHGSIVFPAIIPLSLILILFFLFIIPLFSLGVGGVLLFLFMATLLIFFIVSIFIRWMGTITVLTTRRIITIERVGFLKKTVKEYTLDTITEISYTSKGVLPILFRLGDVHITGLYTGAHHTVASNIANPQQALDQISGCVSRFTRLRAMASSLSKNSSKEIDMFDEEESRPLRIEGEKENERNATNWR